MEGKNNPRLAPLFLFLAINTIFNHCPKSLKFATSFSKNQTKVCPAIVHDVLVHVTDWPFT